MICIQIFAYLNLHFILRSTAYILHGLVWIHAYMYVCMCVCGYVCVCFAKKIYKRIFMYKLCLRIGIHQQPHFYYQLFMTTTLIILRFHITAILVKYFIQVYILVIRVAGTWIRKRNVVFTNRLFLISAMLFDKRFTGQRYVTEVYNRTLYSNIWLLFFVLQLYRSI